MNAVIANPRVRVVPRSELHHETEGVTRGYAHLAELEPGAPGALDLAPLTLFAEGWVHPGEGFPMHEHSGIENLLFVRSGAFHHRDDLGNDCVAGPGTLALLSAGSPVSHAETVHGDDSVHAVVIWLATPVAHPRFERKVVDADVAVQVLASGRGEGGMALGVPATLRHVRLRSGERSTLPVSGRGYLMALTGDYRVAGRWARAGERVLLDGSGVVALEAESELELLALDLG